MRLAAVRPPTNLMLAKELAEFPVEAISVFETLGLDNRLDAVTCSTHAPSPISLLNVSYHDLFDRSDCHKPSHACYMLTIIAQLMAKSH